MATFVGTNGNNSWTIIEPGSWSIDGLGGVDVVDFGIMFPQDFTITQGSAGQVFVDSVSAASGGMNATLNNIELLTFANRSRTIDLRTYFQPVVQEITGTAGADLITAGSSAQQRIDALAGIDTVALSGMRASWTLAPKTGGGFTAAQASTTPTNVELQRVERLQFADSKLALDVDLTNLLNPDTNRAGQVALLLAAVFGRESVANPSFAGIGLSLLDGGMSFEALTKLALDVRLGASHSSAQVVDLLYTNVIGVAPTPEINKSFADWIDSGSLTEAQLGVIAATHGINVSNVNLVGLASSGLPYI